MKENGGVPVDDFTLMKNAYTNKKTGVIQDGLIQDVIQVVENRKEDLLATQASMCEEGDSASSNSLTVEQLNNLVLEVHSNFFLLCMCDMCVCVSMCVICICYFSFRLFQRKRAVMLDWLVRPEGLLLLLQLTIHWFMSLWSRLRPKIRRLSSSRMTMLKSGLSCSKTERLWSKTMFSPRPCCRSLGADSVKTFSCFFNFQKLFITFHNFNV